eukprot:SM000096S24896  [mRNA]  locus=s96:394062:396180:+ [translate_table: standard]
MELLCVVRALLKKIRCRVLVGDRVLVGGVDWTARRGMVEDVLPRVSEVLDPPVANVDFILLLFALDRPRLDAAALSRFLVAAEASAVPFALALNKADLVPLEVSALPPLHGQPLTLAFAICRLTVVESWRSRLRSWGYNPVVCSVEKRAGLAELTQVLRSRVTVVAGPSGVGKSSLINALWQGSSDGPAAATTASSEQTHGASAGDAAGRSPAGVVLAPAVDEDAEEEWHCAAATMLRCAVGTQVHESSHDFRGVRVGGVSDRSGRGRHTTRHVSMLRLPLGGLLADTPGFAQPSLGAVSSAGLAQCFPEVRMRTEEASCSFANCQHLGEPGCAVGSDWERQEHYTSLLTEIQRREEVEKREVGTKRESQIRYKVGAAGVQLPEPRLVKKKHRRESRRQAHQEVEDSLFDAEEEQQELVANSKTFS